MPLLEDYIMNFGVQNFYKDTRMLWRMAQLYETQGEKEKAKAMYKLVLKHHRNNVLGDTVMHYYRAMERDDREVYIPLDFYYRLVEFRRNIDTLRPPTGVLLSMGPEVNGKYPDYGPTVAHNEDTLIFTSRRTKRKDAVMQLNPTANEDLYLSQGIEGYWDEAVPMKDINTQYNEGSAILSKDGKTLFFVRCNAPGSYGDCDLYMAKLTAAGTWSDIKNLGAGINSVAWDSQPALSFTEDTLYFSSNRNGGFGLSDLYYTTRLSNGAWSRAYNLGPVINTKANEVSPFMHPSYHVLYFSSNGQLMNFGDFAVNSIVSGGAVIEALRLRRRSVAALLKVCVSMCVGMELGHMLYVRGYVLGKGGQCKFIDDEEQQARRVIVWSSRWCYYPSCYTSWIGVVSMMFCSMWIIRGSGYDPRSVSLPVPLSAGRRGLMRV